MGISAREKRVTPPPKTGSTCARSTSPLQPAEPRFNARAGVPSLGRCGIRHQRSVSCGVDRSDKDHCTLTCGNVRPAARGEGAPVAGPTVARPDTAGTCAAKRVMCRRGRASQRMSTRGTLLQASASCRPLRRGPVGGRLDEYVHEVVRWRGLSGWRQGRSEPEQARDRRPHPSPVRRPWRGPRRALAARQQGGGLPPHARVRVLPSLGAPVRPRAAVRISASSSNGPPGSAGDWS
jgi:hypothetical protein